MFPPSQNEEAKTKRNDIKKWLQLVLSSDNGSSPHKKNLSKQPIQVSLSLRIDALLILTHSQERDGHETVANDGDPLAGIDRTDFYRRLRIPQTS